MKRSITTLSILIFGLLSCNQYEFEFPDCNIPESPVGTAPNEWEIRENNYIRFTIDGEMYSFGFRHLSVRAPGYGCYLEPDNCPNTVSTFSYEGLFEFDIVNPYHEDDLMAALGRETFFLDYEQLRSMDSPSGEANFTLFTTCGTAVTVSSDPASSFQNKITNVELVDTYEYTREDGSISLTLNYDVEGLISAELSNSGKTYQLAGDYRLSLFVQRLK